MDKNSKHSSTETQQWPPISYEELVWEEASTDGSTSNGSVTITKGKGNIGSIGNDASDDANKKTVEDSGKQGSSSHRSARIGFGSFSPDRSTETHYQAALPLLIAERSVTISDDLSARISAILVEMARFDVELAQRADNVPTMLLRSESSASSQIDRLTSTAQSVALAELYPKASSDARLVVANMAATEKALELPPGLTLEGIVSINSVLVDDRDLDDPLNGQLAAQPNNELSSKSSNSSGSKSAGKSDAESNGKKLDGKSDSKLDNQTYSAFEKFRQKPVWHGGTSFTPHTALFVSPAFQRVPEYMADLIEFGTRSDLNPVVKAAILYAQFETVHPFLTANGPTGRALVHHIFKESGVLSSTLIPVSVGFLHNIDSLLDALRLYREGNPIAIIEEFVDALEVALFVSRVTEASIESVLEDWDGLVGHRKGSKIRMLPKTLVKQPVVNSAYLAESLGVTQRTATTLILRACEYGMLRHMGKKQRGDFYQSDAIINVLDEINQASTFRTIRIA